MESPCSSIGSETGFGAGSDLDYVARDIGEDLKDALDEFQLDKDGLDNWILMWRIASFWVPTALLVVLNLILKYTVNVTNLLVQDCCNIQIGEPDCNNRFNRINTSIICALS